MTKRIGSHTLSRRGLLRWGLAAAGAAWLPAGAAGPTGALAATEALRTRAIPHGAERLPMVGLGTAIVFDIDPTSQGLAGPTAVVRALVGGGGSLIDTAPSYGNAESVIGEILTRTGLRDRVFLATKLEHDSFDDPEAGLHSSLQRLRTGHVDLLQFHNVDAADLDLAPLRALKARGLCRFTGITTTFRGAYAASEAILKRQKPDFLEVDYAIDNPDAEQRLLPVAQEQGTAVLTALPFGRGRLFRTALGRQLPAWAAEFDCHSWAQFFLKWVLGHPAVTAAIPGTDKAAHMTDNLGAAMGRLPDAAMRARMASFVRSL